ncbi:MAG: outer membrane protein assembly factor BamA [Mucilaginibacter sp.]|uniref:outer membrane protein assembly factor BamA n=1 Tax=Mucilaginibacter sp. TaxID=1882438 RepID=UPI0034E49085
MNRYFIAIIFCAFSSVALAQAVRQQTATPILPADSLSYLNPKELTVGTVTVTGSQYLDKDVLIKISQLNKGDKITVPGDATSNVIKNLWLQGLFDDVKLLYTLRNDTINFEINVKERPRLSKLNIKGLRKGEVEDIQKKLKDKTGKIVNENLINTTTAIIKKHFAEKGYLNATVDIKQRKDNGEANSLILDAFVDKKTKVKVNSIVFTGNSAFKDAKLKKYLKKTREKKWYNVFGSKKFLRDKYEEDKQTLVAKMQANGYRDAEILSDSVWKHDDKTVNIKIKVYEGPKYYFGDIVWSGNAKYPSKILNTLLRIKKGDVFSEEELNKRLSGSSNGDDISSLYLNDGYLTYQTDPVQKRIHNDTIDVDLRVYEGPQYTINNVVIKGNEVTNDKVIRREIRTKPGQKFSKEAIIRSTQAITQLGNFDEQKIDPRPTNINPNDGTVDILYNVVEKPSDQIELSGGFGGGSIVGTLGLTFNNFSLRNIFNLKAYKPLPKGDGEKLSLRGQANGKNYQNFSFTYSEPWFGGKKPVNFGITAYTQLQSNGSNIIGFQRKKGDIDYYGITINGVSATIGKQLRWPDDYFNLSHTLSFDHYNLDHYPGYLFANGKSINIKLTETFSRYSLDAPIYPTSGSNIRLTAQLTPPYSLFNNVNYAIATPEERYHFVEYYKAKFEAQWFQKVYGKLVLKAQTQFGFLSSYNKAVGQSPFERFKLGGSGMQSYQFLQGSEIIGLRGYEDFQIVPNGSNINIASSSGSPIFDKFQLELRHPVIASQSATIFLLAFTEGGNTWNSFNDFAPFNVRRSAGVGARIFLPIFGLLGLDYGYGFDAIPGAPAANKGHFHFSIAQSLSGAFN